MQQDHLRSVPVTGSGQPAVQKTGRARPRPRATRALPTDRLKFDVQVTALLAFAVASDNGKRAVTSEDLARRLSVATATAGLNNMFFAESGLITRESKGRYMPTAAVIEFARQCSFSSDRARFLLAEPLKSTWFYEEVAKQLKMGPTTDAKMIEVLAGAAGVNADRRSQLALLLQWLEYVGLIEGSPGGHVRLANGAATAQMPGETPPSDPPDVAASPADPATTRPTTDSGREVPEPRQPDAVLTFSFDFAMTAEDLSKLSPEQIRAVFESVGQVMSLKAVRPS
jgi:hypothetical protein